MVQFSTLLGAFALTAATVSAHPNIFPRDLPDTSGNKNIGNGNGAQFIGGQCNGQADCNPSACCAKFPFGGTTIGLCSGTGADKQAGKQGCGFEGGTATPATPAKPDGAAGAAGASVSSAVAPGASSNPSSVTPPGSPKLVADPNSATHFGKKDGQQFITGGCTSDADCATNCCALVRPQDGSPNFGICSNIGPGTPFAGEKDGCGFPVGGGGAKAPTK
ncbi:hypothetical protein B0T26DRAFT_868101 [Lasiosphaeria miniovina]|uniref:Biotrophy-associated secreted protein 2 n=1 Tax=Lasiosphaeria miniovina TaxID=1954250 RepID=A0AA40BJ93_9PEZI|nr:uncharacterized protein B0T26DRAFT_868101 [Lasiosphaeria miniovina]KAK0735223.1 hypothetical protein B0T26DRAFT_868101 [Lasiosphaeria miniovina]